MLEQPPTSEQEAAIVVLAGFGEVALAVVVEGASLLEADRRNTARP
jgi:hypothetical protein